LQDFGLKDKDRPLFEQVKKQIQHRKINELICWDLDRLYRKLNFLSSARYTTVRLILLDSNG